MSARESDLYRVYVLPFGIFMGWTLLLQLAGPLVAWDHPSAPWWRQAPEQIVYPLQTLTAGWFVWRVRRRVSWNCSSHGILLGAAAGIAGIAVWLLPAICTRYWPDCALADPTLTSGGFDPAAVFSAQPAIMAAYAMRFLRAVVVVACVEELFWRGFLTRFLIDRDHPQNVPIGAASLLSWLGTTLAFMFVHQPKDYPAAFLYGSLAYLLVVRTRSIGAAVVMHALANLILGLAAVIWGMPGLW